MPRDPSGVYTLPAGTQAVTGTPISSAKYNQATRDLEADANVPRPINAGGTGASNAEAARLALRAASRSNDAGATEPASPVAGMLWFDTVAGTMKQRNAANSAWEAVTVGTVLNPIDLTASDNLNNLRTPGIYNNGAAVNTPGNNYPVNSAGSLTVLRTGGVSVSQIYSRYATGELWIRSYDQNTSAWSTWTRVVTTSDNPVYHGGVVNPATTFAAAFVENAYPAIRFRETDQPTDQKVWDIAASNSDLHFITRDDNNAFVSVSYIIHRNGALSSAQSIVTRGAGDARYALKAMNVGDVDSYALLSCTDPAAVAPGEIRAGSSLRYASAYGSFDSNPTPTGSWRCMGSISSGAIGGSGKVTQFRRIN